MTPRRREVWRQVRAEIRSELVAETGDTVHPYRTSAQLALDRFLDGRRRLVRARWRVRRSRSAARWYAGIPPVSVQVPCGGDVHTVSWRRGRLVLEDHDLRVEAVLHRVGGDPPPCYAILLAWRSYRFSTVPRANPKPLRAEARGSKTAIGLRRMTLPEVLADTSHVQRSWAATDVDAYVQKWTSARQQMRSVREARIRRLRDRGGFRPFTWWMIRRLEGAEQRVLRRRRRRGTSDPFVGFYAEDPTRARAQEHVRTMQRRWERGREASILRSLPGPLLDRFEMGVQIGLHRRRA